MPMPSLRRCVAALVALLACAAVAGAESAFEFDPPEQFGTFAAGTFDDSGLRLGPAELSILQLDAGQVRLQTRSKLEAGGAMQAFEVRLPARMLDIQRDREDLLG